ncbi:hypothetical protein ILFOPFJJ_07040 [Ensifer psoraleae]|nr:hypothetical protein [Sinorhizobium psoraleae]
MGRCGISPEDEVTRRLMTVPGIRVMTALTFRHRTYDPSNPASSKVSRQFEAYHIPFATYRNKPRALRVRLVQFPTMSDTQRS